MDNRPRRPFLKGSLISGAIALSLIALFLVPGMRPRDWLLSHWQQELPALSQKEAVARIDQIAAFGPDGIPVLVQALADRRPDVVRAAEKSISAEIARWQMLSPDKSTPLVAQLARLLAEHTASFEPTQRRFAANVAIRLVVWPIDGNAREADRLAAHCEQILRSSSAALRSDDVGYQPDVPEPRQLQPASALANSPATPVPGGQLPISPAAVPEPPAEPSSPETMRRLTSIPTLPPRLIAPPRTMTVAPQQPADIAGPVAQQASPDLVQDQPANSADPPPRNPNAVPQDMHGLPVIDVMKQLHAPDENLVNDARLELVRRHFQPRHIQIARQMTSPDPRERRLLAEALPKIAGVDPAPWLLELSRDEVPEVRRAVVTILGTSADPKYRERLQAMNREERDPAVLRQVRQILNRRR